MPSELSSSKHALEDPSLLAAALRCLDEWSHRWRQLQSGELPEICQLRQWGSDFDHHQAWTIAPVLIGPGCAEKIHGVTRESALIASLVLKEIYPMTYRMLAPWIAAERLNYVAFSLLEPGAVLRAHRHQNAGCAKLHVCIEHLQLCGLMHHNKLPDGSLRKIIHHWRTPGQACFFDDNYLHSAWNMSGDPRVMVVMDYRV